MSRRLARAAPLLVALAVGCRTDCTPRPGAHARNVVLVTVDTLRADHLGCYGNPTVRTPHLDRLATEGALFEHCVSQTNVTVPSHLTLLSSLPLGEHGVFGNEQTRAPRPVTVLPDLFRQAGYRAAGFVSAVHLGPKGPLGSLLGSLERWEAPPGNVLRAAETNDRAFRWLRQTCREPFFLWMHYWDPHMPYEPPPPFTRAYYQGDPRDAGSTGMEPVRLKWFFYDVRDIRPALAARARDVRAIKRQLDVRTRDVQELVLHPELLSGSDNGTPLRPRVLALAAFLRGRLPYRRHLADFLTGVRDVRFPLAEYAGEVSYVDQEIGRLRAEIEALAIADRTILLVVADHGEALGEHGIYFDHLGLHDPVLHVPLIIWAPARVAPTRRGERVSTLDVAPTLLRLAGLDVAPGMRGRDLFGALRPDEPFIAESSKRLQATIRDGRWKLIRTLKSFHYFDTFARDSGATELYDLTADPGEQRNIVTDEPVVAADLAARLDAWLAARPAADGDQPSVLSAERREQLRALGYLQ